MSFVTRIPLPTIPEDALLFYDESTGLFYFLVNGEAQYLNWESL